MRLLTRPQWKRLGLTSVFAGIITLGGYAFNFTDFIIRWALDPKFDAAWAHQYRHVTAYAVSFFILAGVFRVFPPLRRIGDRVLNAVAPEPPHFIDTNLELTGADPLHPRAPDKNFLGRDKEMGFLRQFAGDDSRVLWWSLYGPNGVGKSRLAIEWLKKLRTTDRRWDVGTLPEDRIQKVPATLRASDIGGWKPRRDTAIVIDEMTDREELWEFIAALSRVGENSRHRIRVLIVDVVPLYDPPDPSSHAARAQAAIIRASRYTDKKEGKSKAPLPLGPLEQADWLELAAAYKHDNAPTVKEYEKFGGFPLFAKLGANPWMELGVRATSLLRIANARLKEDGLRVIALAALAGPVDSAVRLEVAPNAGNVDKLREFFAESDWPSLSHTLPAIKPNAFAQDILLRALVLGPNQNADLESLCTSAFAARGRDMLFRIGLLWTERPEARLAYLLERGQEDGARGLAEELGLDPSPAIARARVLLELDKHRTKLGQHLILDEVEQLLRRMNDLSIFSVSYFTDMKSFFYPKIEGTHRTDDHIQFNDDIHQDRIRHDNALKIEELWQRLRVITAGCIGVRDIHLRRLEAAFLAIKNLRHAALYSGAGETLLDHIQHDVQDVVELHGPNDREIQALYLMILCESAVAAAKNGNQTRLEERWEKGQGIFIRFLDDGLIQIVWLYFNHLITHMFLSSKDEAASDWVDRARDAAASLPSLDDFSEALISKFELNVFNHRHEQASIVDANRALERISKLCLIGKNNGTYDVYMDGVLTLGDVCRVYARLRDNERYNDTLTKFEQAVEEQPIRRLIEGLIIFYSQREQLRGPAVADLRLEKIERLARKHAGGLSLPTRFWMMIAYHHALTNDVDGTNDHRRQRLFDRARSLWCEHQDEPKFTFWYACAMYARAEQLATHDEIGNAIGLVETFINESRKPWVEAAAETVMDCVNMLIALCSERKDADGTIAGIGIARKIAEAYPLNLKIQHDARRYGVHRLATARASVFLER